METSTSLLNQEISDLHFSHYVNSPTGLVIRTESPNGNVIYHLYDNGEITHQKGGWAYQQRSEFTLRSRLFYGKSPYTFPQKTHDHTYAILTEEECLAMREKMKILAGK